MNLSHRNAIITATEKIVDMDSDEKRKLLLTILGTNPTIVLRALKVEAIKPGQLYKVAITSLNGENRKINVIKVAREIMGIGLADAKAWAEGGNMAPDQNPAGVFGQHLTLDAAKRLLEKVKASMMNSGNLLPKVEIVTDGYHIMQLPSTWTNSNY